MPSKVLIVEDYEDQRVPLALITAGWGYEAQTAHDGQDAIEKLATFAADVIVTDLAMPRLDGAGLLQWLGERGKVLPTIVVSAYGDISKAVSLVHHLGAFWFLEKPVEYDVLKVLLERAVEQSNLLKEKERLERQLAYSGMLGEMVGRSGAMQQIFALIQQVAPTGAPVLITGESGTGKELVSKAIHQLSRRSNGPFVAVNCAALPESLIESELFGHERGAFTGAVERRAGCFELAQGGTLLLDEIGEMPPSTQAKLLRVLENGRVRRLGGSSELPLDVRIVAATNKDPAVAISRGEMRQDLYFRLSVFRIAIPPLREHLEDVPLMAAAMLRELNQKHSCRVAGLEPEVLRWLQQYDWPGNVRELRNILERAVILAGQDTIRLAHLPQLEPVVRQAAEPAPVSGQAPSPNLPDNSLLLPVGATMEEAERRFILKTLAHNAGNKTRTAAMLNMSLKTLHAKLKRYALEGIAALPGIFG